MEFFIEKRLHSLERRSTFASAFAKSAGHKRLEKEKRG